MANSPAAERAVAAINRDHDAEDLGVSIRPSRSSWLAMAIRPDPRLAESARSSGPPGRRLRTDYSARPSRHRRRPLQAAPRPAQSQQPAAITGFCPTGRMTSFSVLARVIAADLDSALEHHRGVRAAKAEGVGQHRVHLFLHRLMRGQIDRRLNRRIVQVERWRANAVAHGQNGEDRLNRAGSAQQGGRWRILVELITDIARGIAEQALHRAQFDLVALGRRGAVGVDIVDVGRRQARAL
jgi:hypothetical protein